MDPEKLKEIGASMSEPGKQKDVTLIVWGGTALIIIWGICKLVEWI